MSGINVTYTYDKYGNVKEKYTNGTLTYQGIADNTGTITKVIDPVNNLSYTSSYDSTDRLISTTVLNTTTNTRKAEYEYDFDLNNNVTKVSTKTSTSSDTVAYSYVEDNLPLTAAMPSGTTATYTYDGLGRLTDSSLNTVNPVNKAYTYEAANDYGTGYTTNLIKTETINGDTYEYGYDDAGNINCIKKKRSNDPYFTDIAAYQYDSLGQLITSTDKENNIMYVYTYYPGGNLHKEKIYDISGDTDVLIDSITYTYDDTAWEDLLTGYDGDVIVYDEIGNPETYRDGIELKWTNGRQLQSYSKNNQTTTYTYDTNGMRLAKNVNGLQYTYLYNGGKLMQETRGNDIVDYFYDANGQAVALRHKTSSNDSGTYYYYAYNFRGDILGLYNAAGSLYRTYTYDAWGNILSVKDANGTDITSQTDIAHLQSLRYRGYYYDSDTGFYYLQSRYYDPVTHRFINADGLVSTGTGILGYNMFAYCNNNPITLSDYNGKCGDPTCVNCNPFWNEYLSDPVNLEWQYTINPDFRINDCSLYYVGSITITKTRIIKNSSEVYVSATYRQYYKYDKDGGIINDSIYSTLSCIDIRIPDFTDINSITLTMGIQDTYFESVEISQSVFKKYVFWDTAFEFYFMGANIDILYNDGTKDNINVNLSGLSELMWGA